MSTRQNETGKWMSWSIGILIFLGLTKTALCAAPAETTSVELNAHFRQLETQIAALQNELVEQNKKHELEIQEIKRQIEIKGPVPLAPSVPSKPRTTKENLRHYILEKPNTLPKEDEKLDTKSGMGSLEIGTLLQEWYTIDDHAKDNFRHRRLELNFSGKLMDHLKWKLQIDPSLTREDASTKSILKDAYLAFDGIPHHVVKLGQYKIPLTEEGFRSSALIDTIERSFIARTFSDKRDIGLMGEGKWKYLDYQIGVFNGDEANRFDSNDQKDFVARFVAKPFPDTPLLKGLQGGTSMYYRATNDSAAEKKRIAVETRYEYGPLSLKTEYLKAQDAGVPANGWYAQVGYFILPRWQPIFKIEGFDPNERTPKDKEYDTTIGLNYFLVYPTTKFQFNYVHKDAKDNGTTDNQLIGAAQYAF